MDQASLAVLEGLQNHFLENPLQPARSADVASAIRLILRLFDQTEEELKALSACIDDLALPKKGGNHA